MKVSSFNMDEELLAKATELAEDGHPQACAYLGSQYYYGWEIEQDYAKAMKYLTVAAEAGDGMSQFLLGVMYGSGRGVEKDLDATYKWFLAAAENGIPEAMFNVGCMLMKNDNEEDRARGKEWIIKSANAGYDTAADTLRDL